MRLLVITVARKPLAESSVTRNVLRYGTGGLDLDACRVETMSRPLREKTGERSPGTSFDTLHSRAVGGTDLGRWPANLILQHKAGCQRTGTKKVRTPGSYIASSTTLNQRAYGKGLGGSREGEISSHYGDVDGMETVDAWECVPGCPVADLDDQSGDISSQRTRTDPTAPTAAGMWLFKDIRKIRGPDYLNEVGGASRFFKQVKL